MNIQDKDIATIEALHDLLLDNRICKTHHPALKNARLLTRRMYNEVELTRSTCSHEKREYIGSNLMKCLGCGKISK